MISLYALPAPLPADRGLERADGRLDARFGGHGEVFHFEADPTVVADHAHDGEELLPPLQVVTCADSNVVPGPVGDVIDALELQQAVYFGQPSLDAGVLAVAMMDRIAQG